jgi:glutamine amidotransferase-like uncharacterized protein
MLGPDEVVKIRFALILVLFIGITILPCGAYSQESADSQKDVMLLFPKEHRTDGYFNKHDVVTYMKTAKKLGLSTKFVGYSFINDKTSFLDKNGRPKFSVLILPGGIPQYWFAKHPETKERQAGINRQGVKNILEFIKAGGSSIAICYCGSMLFAKDLEFLCSSVTEIRNKKFEEYYIHRNQGLFMKVCGIYAFDGILRGPQESNMKKVPGLPPYPRITFLPIKMNPENEIVKNGNLPSVIHQTVVGGGSLLPSKNQEIEAVGWYPNGTIAIGIVPYGKGKIILSNPHPNIAGERAQFWAKGVMGIHCRNWGWTEQMIADGQKLIKDLHDPDGHQPDWRLTREMLNYAYTKALQSNAP